MYNIQWTNEVRFPCYLFSIPPNHGCLGKVCDRKEMDGLQGNCNITPSYQDRYIRLVVGDFHARLLVHIIGVTSADIEAKRIWIMITNACAVMNVVIVVYFYTMIYHGIRQRRAITWCYTWRDDSQRRFLAQHSVATLLRHCFEWLRHCSNIATLCCAKNRRCESSRAKSPV